MEKRTVLEARKKRTCNRCKALVYEQGIGWRCELEHRIDENNAVPLEYCEKPLTNSDYFYFYQFTKAGRAFSSRGIDSQQ